MKGRANSVASDETEGQKCDRSVSTSQRHESKARQSRGSASFSLTKTAPPSRSASRARERRRSTLVSVRWPSTHCSQTRS